MDFQFSNIYALVSALLAAINNGSKKSIIPENRFDVHHKNPSPFFNVFVITNEARSLWHWAYAIHNEVIEHWSIIMCYTYIIESVFKCNGSGVYSWKKACDWDE